MAIQIDLDGSSARINEPNEEDFAVRFAFGLETDRTKYSQLFRTYN